MKTIQETLRSAHECRAEAKRTKHSGQKRFYRNLEQRFLRIAELKQWFYELTPEVRLRSD